MITEITEIIDSKGHCTYHVEHRGADLYVKVEGGRRMPHDWILDEANEIIDEQERTAQK